jgi:hypothetical protein
MRADVQAQAAAARQNVRKERFYGEIFGR